MEGGIETLHRGRSRHIASGPAHNKMRRRSQNRPEAGVSEPVPLADQLGAGVKAWVFGAAAQGTQPEGRCLDVYVSGERAVIMEKEFFGRRPLVAYAGRAYALRLIGPSKVSEEIFVRKHPEAIRVL